MTFTVAQTKGLLKYSDGSLCVNLHMSMLPLLGIFFFLVPFVGVVQVSQQIDNRQSKVRFFIIYDLVYTTDYEGQRISLILVSDSVNL